MQYQWPGWRNVHIDGEHRQSSVNMDRISQGCVAWRYPLGIPRVPRAPGDGYIPQIDGNYTLPAGQSHMSYTDFLTDSEAGGDACDDAIGQTLFSANRTGRDWAIFVPVVLPQIPQLSPAARGPNRLQQFLARVTRQVWLPFRRR